MKRFIKICLVLLLISTPMIMCAQDANDAVVRGITVGRAKSIGAGVLALISLVIGWRAKLRSNRGDNKRTGAVGAIMLGLISVILSLIHLSTSASAAFGSGSGKAGAIVALVLGLCGIILGGLANRKLAKNRL